MIPRPAFVCRLCRKHKGKTHQQRKKNGLVVFTFYREASAEPTTFLGGGGLNTQGRDERDTTATTQSKTRRHAASIIDPSLHRNTRVRRRSAHQPPSTRPPTQQGTTRGRPLASPRRLRCAPIGFGVFRATPPPFFFPRPARARSASLSLHRGVCEDDGGVTRKRVGGTFSSRAHNQQPRKLLRVATTKKPHGLVFFYFWVPCR